jgi:uncharacterized protein (DUF1697 family)
MQNSIKYIALLRGINVGGKNKVEMPRLKSLLESIGLTDVHTYINSGNVLFSSNGKAELILSNIEVNFKKEFDFEVPILVISQNDIVRIAKEVPNGWKNDKEQKTDVAYLFPEIDHKGIVNELPIKKEYVNLIYTPGAIIWNMDRKNQNKSQLNKLVGHKLYKSMTVRNINTARYLGAWNVK